MHENKHEKSSEEKRARKLVFFAFRRFYTKCTIKTLYLVFLDKFFFDPAPFDLI